MPRRAKWTASGAAHAWADTLMACARVAHSKLRRRVLHADARIVRSKPRSQDFIGPQLRLDFRGVLRDRRRPPALERTRRRHLVAWRRVCLRAARHVLDGAARPAQQSMGATGRAAARHRQPGADGTDLCRRDRADGPAHPAAAQGLAALAARSIRDHVLGAVQSVRGAPGRDARPNSRRNRRSGRCFRC